MCVFEEGGAAFFVAPSFPHSSSARPHPHKTSQPRSLQQGESIRDFFYLVYAVGCDELNRALPFSTLHYCISRDRLDVNTTQFEFDVILSFGVSERSSFISVFYYLK